MATINVAVVHELGRTEAIRRLRIFEQELREAYHDCVRGDIRWYKDGAGFQGSGRGISVSGKVHVTDRRVEVRAKVKFPLRMRLFEERILNDAKVKIREHLTNILAF